MFSAEAYDFIGGVRTTKRIAMVIRRVFGVSRHLACIGRLSSLPGWTV